METDHLKARCLCKDYDQGVYPGCPIHAKPEPVPYPQCSVHGSQPDEDCSTCLGNVNNWHPIAEHPVLGNVDMVNHPVHYSATEGVPFECIVVVRDLSFCIGNAVKYLWRADRKNGREDFEKAQWYLRDAIKWNSPFYIGNTPMQFNARCATLVRAQSDPLRRKFFQALRAQQPRWMLDAVDEMLAA